MNNSNEATFESRDPTPTLAARMDELEQLFGLLLEIVKDLLKAQAEFAGREEVLP
jgi:hypothetical protein